MKREELIGGIRDGIPIALGYFAVSVAFGVSAVLGNIPSWAATLISLTNLTSAGQKAGIEIMMELGKVTEIVLATLIINLRYFLMSISLSQKVEQDMPIWKRFLVSFGITDEIYAVSMNRKRDLSAIYMAGLIIPPIIGWTGGTLVGSVATGFMPEIVASAMGIALYGMFIAVIVPPSRDKLNVFCAVVMAIAMSVGFTCLPNLKKISFGWSIIIITLIVSAIAATIFPVKESEEDGQ